MENNYTLEDIKKAFDAGSELISFEWHKAEFCLGGKKCSCKGVTLKYNSFEEWIKNNYPQQ
jgi:hypothetical protein